MSNATRSLLGFLVLAGGAAGCGDDLTGPELAQLLETTWDATTLEYVPLQGGGAIELVSQGWEFQFTVIEGFFVFNKVSPTDTVSKRGSVIFTSSSDFVLSFESGDEGTGLFHFADDARTLTLWWNNGAELDVDHDRVNDVNRIKMVLARRTR